MITYTISELKEILRKHALWVVGNPRGHIANLSGADLRGANLSGADLIRAYLFEADLRGADLSGADLRGAYLFAANLSGANLSGADLRGVDLSGADLSRANLSRANLSRANLRGANLSGAYLRGADLFAANLSGANLSGADLNFPIACPEEGSFIGFKKCHGNLIVKLEIPEDAKRCSATGRKCRCDKAKVLSITKLDGTPVEIDFVSSLYNPDFEYRVGEIVKVDNFEENRWKECAPGIHFFTTRTEAMNYHM